MRRRHRDTSLPLGNVIHVLQLGTTAYKSALDVQQRLVELRKQGRAADTLLLLEHPPVITLGRNAKLANVLRSREELAKRGVEMFECDRGGDVTYHGPGQLVGYPIFDLRGFGASDGKRKTLGPVEFVRRIEEALIRTCGDMRIPCTRVPGLTGVWTSAESEHEQKKIAAIGIHISRGVTSHGFALNVNTDLNEFGLIVPCGISDRAVTSMQQELGGGELLNPDKVAHAISRNFGRVFAKQTLWLESLDDIVRAAGPANQDTPLRTPEELRHLAQEDEVFPA